MSTSFDAPQMSSSEGEPKDVVNALIAQSIPPMHGLGIRVEELSPEHAVSAVPLEGNGNHLGTMYAATIFGAAEVVGGALAIANFDLAHYYPTVKSVRIEYRRPATTDIRVAADLDQVTCARLRRDVAAAGKAEFEVDMVIRDLSDTIVAVAHGVYQVRAR
ncbi:YiiD C-terminal domain-containing protein [Nocardia sp. NPDC059239]|uniref:YiiD C-terminal domain-containing protein n=1 Tax=unclassified Nocardia TaxID=2637762 RepID=UPI0036B631BC